MHAKRRKNIQYVYFRQNNRKPDTYMTTYKEVDKQKIFKRKKQSSFI